MYDSTAGGGTTVPPVETPEKPEKPAKPEQKRRTISLTNARPVSIIEEEWPEIAKGEYGDDNAEVLNINIRVRASQYGRYLVHGGYWAYPEQEDGPESARVGRLLTFEQSNDEGLCIAILEVADELRERIVSKGGSTPNAGPDLRQFVIFAVDRCFQDLTPMPITR